MKVEYRSNNSGGSWWLEDKHWIALEKAGWKVDWAKDWKEDGSEGFRDKGGRYMGALARGAEIEGMKLREAVDHWEDATGLCATDAGCPCCGPPHEFTEYDDKGNYVESGPSTEYSAHF